MKMKNEIIKGDFPEGSNIDFTNYFSKEVQTFHKSKLFAFYMNWNKAKKVLL